MVSTGARRGDETGPTEVALGLPPYGVVVVAPAARVAVPGALMGIVFSHEGTGTGANVDGKVGSEVASTVINSAHADTSTSRVG